MENAKTDHVHLETTVAKSMLHVDTPEETVAHE